MNWLHGVESLILYIYNVV